jgi:hypothetical protein
MAPDNNPMKNFTNNQLKSMLGAKSREAVVSNVGVNSISLQTPGSSFATSSNNPFSSQSSKSGGINWNQYFNNYNPAQTIPATYDVRDKFPMCVNRIKDQAQCGSCWAFATTNVLEYRICMATKG